MADWVNMHHPETGGTARATPDAFDRYWAAKGWQLTEPESPGATPMEPAADQATEQEAS